MESGRSPRRTPFLSFHQLLRACLYAVVELAIVLPAAMVQLPFGVLSLRVRSIFTHVTSSAYAFVSEVTVACSEVGMSLVSILRELSDRLFGRLVVFVVPSTSRLLPTCYMVDATVKLTDILIY